MSETIKSATTSGKPWVLGLDLGIRSVGWAVVGADVDSDPQLAPNNLYDVGARDFSPTENMDKE